MDRIFVQIASYRDEDCQRTVKNLFAQAKYPKRVVVGICFVHDSEQDAGFFKEFQDLSESQLRILKVPLAEENGMNWAKSQVQSLWKGEEYVLQIHSHMRFEKNWDELLIKQLARCPSPKAVLSTSSPGVVPPDVYPYRAETMASFTTVFKMSPDDPQIMVLAGKLINKNSIIPKLPRNAFAVGSFIFSRSTIYEDVPHDPHIYYYNSELAYSARLWTHGYDIFQPDMYILFHWYGRTTPIQMLYRDLNNPRQEESRQRVLHMLRVKPALTAKVLGELEKYGLGTARKMEDFWDFSGIHPQSAVMGVQASKGNFDHPYDDYIQKQRAVEVKQPTIFVQIASYRDPECQWTVKDLFDKATHPDRVNIGICWQYDPEEDQDCFQVSVRPDQVRISPFHWKESQGVCWARHQSQLLYENEDYVLMIDSHMRFVFGWDELLIRELKRCGSQKPVLSNHPGIYTPPHELDKTSTPTALNVGKFTEHGDIRVAGGYMRIKPDKPLQGAFMAAGFVFASGDIVRDVPYDPHMYFNQEEISLTARLFTYGWDIFHPSQIMAYHCYNIGEEVKRRKLHWSDNRDWGQLQDRAKRRFDHLLEYAISDDPMITRDLMTYGLGDVRTLKEFEEYSGIDFKKRTVADKAINYGITDELHRHMRIVTPNPTAVVVGAPVLAFPNPAKASAQHYYTMQLANGQQRHLQVNESAPRGVLIINDYIERELCDAYARYADAQTFTELGVVNYEKTSDQAVATSKHEGRITTHVEIDGMAGEVLTLFNDIYCNRVAPYFGADFEWYERPQILRYPAGGKYNQHADADHWLAEKNEWVRVQDRDYSVLLYLNEDFEGGELHFVNQNFKIKPKPGMLIAFPSDHQYLHAALPTTSGVRYVMVSWGAVLGTTRVRKQVPYASVFVRQKRPKLSN